MFRTESLVLKCDSAVSIGGQGKYIKYISYHYCSSVEQRKTSPK